MHKNSPEDKSTNQISNELKRLREFNKVSLKLNGIDRRLHRLRSLRTRSLTYLQMLEIDNQRLYAENEQLKLAHKSEDPPPRDGNVYLEKLLVSLQHSNVIISDCMHSLLTGSLLSRHNHR
jgi:hypothetical protein